MNSEEEALLMIESRALCVPQQESHLLRKEVAVGADGPHGHFSWLVKLLLVPVWRLDCTGHSLPAGSSVQAAASSRPRKKGLRGMSIS